MSISVPKPFLKVEPGGILAGGKVLEHARNLPAQTEVAVEGGRRMRSGGRAPA
jgi:hypothetical protein